LTSGWTFLLSFASIVAGVLVGMVVRAKIPAAKLGHDTKEVIRLGAGLLATLAAVVISLMIASAKSSYDTQDTHFRQLAAYLVEADQLLAQYGPEAIPVRQLMRKNVPAAMERIWNERATALQNTAFTANSLAETLHAAVETLTPVNDAQRSLKPRIVQASNEIARTRLLIFADGDKPVLTPFMLILIVWLTVIFASFGVFVEPSAIAWTALLIFALSVSSALFLVSDLSQPFAGFMQIPKEPLKYTLAPLN
jgi:hypothetical protein